MKVIKTSLIETPLSVTNNKDEEIFTVPENHIEIEFEDDSRLVLESSDEFYKLIGDAKVTFGSEEVFIDRLFDNNYKIILVNFKLENGDVINRVLSGEYNNKPIYLILIKKG